MLRLQAAMNSKVDPNWVDAAYPYMRAVVIEAAEAMEHHGWKWWKKQSCDLAQLQMELVDIWHFLLSEVLLRETGDLDKAATVLLGHLQNDSTASIVVDGAHFELKQLDLLEKLQLLIATSATNRMEFGLFALILMDCQMSWTELYRQYVGKNVLNFFRQDHGYKDGSYQKIWHGREDNEHLVELMGALPNQAEDFPEKLYLALKQHYPV
jgi:dimeric dUTPase (all-alpha-NTP-PPase superfamily)